MPPLRTCSYLTINFLEQQGQQSKEVNVMITNHLIEEVALKLYVKSGNAEGHDLDNWLEAESIVWDDIEEETQCTLELRT
jgi:hypothetical protein